MQVAHTTGVRLVHAPLDEYYKIDSHGAVHLEGSGFLLMLKGKWLLDVDQDGGLEYRLVSHLVHLDLEPGDPDRDRWIHPCTAVAAWPGLRWNRQESLDLFISRLRSSEGSEMIQEARASLADFCLRILPISEVVCEFHPQIWDRF